MLSSGLSPASSSCKRMINQDRALTTSKHTPCLQSRFKTYYWMRKKQTSWVLRSLSSNVINTSRNYKSIWGVSPWSRKQEDLVTVRDPRPRQHCWKNPTFVAINSLVRVRSASSKLYRLKQIKIQIWDQVFTIAVTWGIVLIKQPVF